MNIRIYQIDSNLDRERVKFLGFDEQREIDPSIYKCVFEGNVDCADLEDVFVKFNTDRHPLHRGHSLSVSDVVEQIDEGTFHYCDNIGFKQIRFDPSQVQTEDDLLRIVMVEPHREPYVSYIQNSLEASQKAVGGYIEHVYNPDNTILVCNEEGKINGLKGNRRITGDVIAGDFFIVGDDEENGTYRSLTDEECDRYMERFAEPENIPQSEIDQHTGCSFFYW